MTAEQRRVYDEVTAGPRGKLIGPLRAAIHRPDLADLWQKFGAILRFGTSLPARLSEIAILVTARRWNSQLEWQVHSEAARKAGVGEAVIEDLRAGRAPIFEREDEREIYEFARELQMTGQVSDTTYAAVFNRWNTIGVVELTSLIGYYTMVSMTLNAHDLPGLDGVPPPLKALDGDGRESDGPFTDLTSIYRARIAAAVESVS